MLEVGETVRFRGLGAGTVVERVERKFQGRNQTFAVLHFIHSDLRAQIPVDDPAVAAKVEPVLSKASLTKLLRRLPEDGRVLPRTWDAREEIGWSAIKEGGPKEWAELLASYARADGAGVAIAASDEEMVRSAIEMFAAELACASAGSFADSLDQVEGAYDRAVEAASSLEQVEHFSAVQSA
jgi:RNA polymerase-interacting CarD/CdnL/TRCF family regulator